MRFTGLLILLWALSSANALAQGDAQAGGLDARIDELQTAHSGASWRVSQRLIDELRPSLDGATLDQRARVDIMDARNSMLAGDFPAAISLMESTLRSPINLKNRVNALELLAQSHSMLNDHPQAFEDLNEALKVSSEVDDPSYRSRVLSLAARMHNSAGEQATALQYAAESLELAQASVDLHAICVAWWTLVRIQESAALLDFALQSSEQLLASCQRSGDPVLIASALSMTGGVYLSRGEYDMAKGWLQRAVNMYEAAGFDWGLQEINVDLGLAYLRSGDVEQGLEMLYESAESADTLSDYRRVLLHEAIAETMAERGDYVEALRQLDLARLNEPDVTEKQRLQRLAYLQAEFEKQRQNQELELLRQQNRLLGKQEETAEALLSKRRLASGVLILVGILMICLLWRFRVDRRRFRRLSEIDRLTGLFNHRRFHHAVEAALAENRKHGKVCSMVAADVDLFKQINDRYGHQAGDQVLRKLGSLLLERFPSPCIVGRVGGEEFAIFLPDHNRLQALQRIRDFRDHIRPIDFNGDSIKFTLSFGLLESRRECRLEKLRARADDALYRAKRSGRNQVIDAADLGIADGL